MLGASAGPLTIPNGSFETPATVFVDINVDSWEKTAKPPDYDEAGGFLWSQLSGIFRNPAAGAADHIVNCDGQQAIWLFAVPGAGFFQDFASRDWNDADPSHAFDATYQVGRSYALTVGVIGSGGGMQRGASLDLAFYFRDAEGNRVIVSSTRVVHDAPMDRTRFVDFTVATPIVQADDAWAGQKIGVQAISSVEAALAGGYWDLDHFRLIEWRPTELGRPRVVAGELVFDVSGETGEHWEILAAASVAAPEPEWISLGTVTHGVEATPFPAGPADRPGRYFRARRLP